MSYICNLMIDQMIKGIQSTIQSQFFRRGDVKSDSDELARLVEGIEILKEFKEIMNPVEVETVIYKNVYNKAIDDFLEKIKERAFNDESYLVKIMSIDYAEAIADQLKER